MIARFFLPFLALAVPGAFGQISLYGPVTVHLKAGDAAPDIVSRKVLSAPGSAPWRQSNLEGRLTVLVFSLRPSQNPQVVAEWNSLVDEFAGKPVQFLWVSGEPGATLLPWLSQHPIRGWVFHDPDGKTGQAYGLGGPATVFIGADGKIMGFGFGGFPPSNEEVNAGLERRITTQRPTPATMKAFLDSHQIVLDAEPFQFHDPDEYKPKFPPSYALHVSPSQDEGGGNFSGDDFKVLRSYTLREAISNVYYGRPSVNRIRISLPTSLDNDKRYDFSILLPQPEGQEKIKARMQQGLEDYFHITSKRESRMAEVYVVSAVPGHAPPLITDAMGGGGGVQFRDDLTDVVGGMRPRSLSAVSGISFTGTADGFCQLLEWTLDRPIVNETHWEGEIEIRDVGSTKNILESLRDEYGLVIAPAQRNSETLVFAPR
jgi:uncharacterized protein (TIGR03435 family)